jgi:hypothetical protein
LRGDVRARPAVVAVHRGRTRANGSFFRYRVAAAFIGQFLSLIRRMRARPPVVAVHHFHAGNPLPDGAKRH